MMKLICTDGSSFHDQYKVEATRPCSFITVLTFEPVPVEDGSPAAAAEQTAHYGY